jgi:BolA protein
VFDSAETAEKIRLILEREFQPVSLRIEDQSHFHKGHKSAGGGGHFLVEMSSARFLGQTPLARQRLVLDSVQGLMDREIHALSMKLNPPKN